VLVSKYNYKPDSPSSRYINKTKAHLSSLSSLTLFHTHYINQPHPTMLYSTFFALGLATAAAAITVTAPSNSTGWTSTGAQVIEWDVSPPSFFFPSFLLFVFLLLFFGLRSSMNSWCWSSRRMRDGKALGGGVISHARTLYQYLLPITTPSPNHSHPYQSTSSRSSCPSPRSLRDRTNPTGSQHRPLKFHYPTNQPLLPKLPYRTSKRSNDIR